MFSRLSLIFSRREIYNSGSIVGCGMAGPPRIFFAVDSGVKCASCIRFSILVITTKPCRFFAPSMDKIPGTRWKRSMWSAVALDFVHILRI